MVDGSNIKKLFAEGKSGQRKMIAVIADDRDGHRKYRLANKDDVRIYKEVEDVLQQKSILLTSKWGFDPVPDEPIHTPDDKEYKPGKLLYNFTPVLLYGLTKWGDLFELSAKA